MTQRTLGMRGPTANMDRVIERLEWAFWSGSDKEQSNVSRNQTATQYQREVSCEVAARLPGRYRKPETNASVRRLRVDAEAVDAIQLSRRITRKTRGRCSRARLLKGE